jgi:hypothetical protein
MNFFYSTPPSNSRRHVILLRGYKHLHDNTNNEHGETKSIK